MAAGGKSEPKITDEAAAAARAREAKLAAALRANLARRKAQARERAAGPGEGAEKPQREG